MHLTYVILFTYPNLYKENKYTFLNLLSYFLTFPSRWLSYGDFTFASYMSVRTIPSSQLPICRNHPGCGCFTVTLPVRLHAPLRVTNPAHDSYQLHVFYLSMITYGIYLLIWVPMGFTSLWVLTDFTSTWLIMGLPLEFWYLWFTTIVFLLSV